MKHHVSIYNPIKKNFFQTTEIEMLLETIISVSWAKIRFNCPKRKKMRNGIIIELIFRT